MIPDNRMFKGQEMVEVDGKAFFRSYKIVRLGKYRMNIQIVSINSSAKQGIAFSLSKEPKFKGSIIINEKEFDPLQYKNQNYVIPVNMCDKKEIVIEVDVSCGYLRLANASDYLDDIPNLAEKISKLTGRTRDQFRSNSYVSGFTAAFSYGNAFWVETLNHNCFRFHCNDHKLDDNYDDLVFDVAFESL